MTEKEYLNEISHYKPDDAFFSVEIYTNSSRQLTRNSKIQLLVKL